MKELILVKMEKRKRKLLPISIVFLLIIGVVGGGVIHYFSNNAILNVDYPFELYDEFGNQLESQEVTRNIRGGDSRTYNVALKNFGDKTLKHKLSNELRFEDGSLPAFNDTKIMFTDNTNGRLIESYSGMIEDIVDIPSNSLINYTIFLQLRDTIPNGTYINNLTSGSGGFNWAK